MIAIMVLSSLAVGGLIVAQNFELLPPAETSVGITQWIALTAIFLWAGNLTYISMKSLRQAVDRLEEEVAKRKLTQNALTVSEMKLKEANKIAGIGIWELQHVNSRLDWTEGIFELFEIDRKNFKATYEAFLDAIHPDDRAQVNLAYTDSLKNGTPYQITHRLLMPDGRIKWVNESCRTFYDELGSPVHSLGIVQDISLQKQASDLWAKTFDSITDPMFILDAKQKIIQSNRAFQKFSEKTMESLSGHHCFSLVQKTDCPIDGCPFVRARISKQRETLELEIDGSFFEIIVEPIIDSKGDLTGAVHIMSDFTQRKHHEQELLKAKEKAQESDRLKSAFLANMSHEIRTPLNSIIGFSELLADSEFETPQKTEFVNQIVVNGNNLLTIISDIVDISKMESGEITMRIGAHPVIGFLNELVTQTTYSVEQNQLQFRTSFQVAEPEEEIAVMADRERLMQVFNNLISNAIKFTSTGCIEIGFKKLNHLIQFHVKDSGIGIPKEFHQQIFERFRQVDSSYTRKFGGNGLGLAISKNLIELMGGTIWVESEEGKGSAFYFTLPAPNN
jgi:PAS domain S-box-containing protein